MTGTEFARDVSQLLAAGMLALSLAFLAMQGPRRLLGGLVAQGALLAAVAAWQSWVRGEWGMAATAVIVLAGSGLAVPAALRALLRRLRLGNGPEPVARPAASLAAGMALIGAAVLAGVFAGNPATTRESLVVATSLLLLGMLVAATRRGALGQVLGLCCAARGALLLALLVPAMPLPGVLAAGVALLEAALVGALLARRMPAGSDLAALFAAAAPGSPTRDQDAAEARGPDSNLRAFPWVRRP